MVLTTQDLSRILEICTTGK